MRATRPRILTGRPRLLRVGVAVLVGVAVVLPVWAAYLAVILPREHVAPNWDVVWVGLDLGLATLAAGAVVALRRRSPWTLVLAGALAAALVCDAWFDVMTSTDDERVLAIALAVFAEIPIAVIAVVIGLRSVRLSSMRRD
jgi:hypothetical protein